MEQNVLTFLTVLLLVIVIFFIVIFLLNAKQILLLGIRCLLFMS